MRILDFYPTNCKNCYKCVRHCSVKAIKMINDQAQIVEEKCIACGNCFLVCPQNARNIHSDLENVENAFQQGKKIIVSIAPSYIGVYDEPYKLISVLKYLGAYLIEETAIGAEQVSKLYSEYIKTTKKNNAITTCCPTVNMMIQNYYPNLIKYLMPIDSPMVAHCKMIRKRHGNDVYIVFLGPCISKKCEAYGYQLSGVMDAVISFEEIDKLMESRNINISEFEESYPDLEGNYKGKKYPLDQGILSGISHIVENSKFTPATISGIDNLKKAFDALSNEEITNVLIEANSCEGGCIGGPAVPKKSRNIYVRKIRAKNKIQILKEKINKNYTLEDKNLNYIRNFRNKQYIHPHFTEEEIKNVLEQTGKHDRSDELNCGACGYDTCRDKAISVLEGLSHPQMCMPYMRSEAEKISNIYFEYSPSIILIVDLDLNILDLNPVGEKAFNISVSSVKSQPLSSIIPDKDFKHVLRTEENMEGRKLNLEKYGLTVYERIIYLPKNKILFGILNDITNDELKKEQITNFKMNTLETADKVIEKQMRVAQEIAGLLGETTAETKSALLKLKKVVLEENK
ncbi:MAG: [Fe-Fe] hydrogenase large subunit C-terminal domain-containing protein [Tissierellia bacterium]|nr:[Fe-Fe] hydrogenase large subunit C-terminal domain-containing protein [Tissierellia bacterium]MDD3226087.1 [Fe-Fe] hydrogenase large subunit C-terminal domain-containing protein [Tissierellia bacterium]MDD3751104.1 [Fe-Fe] hydrogenase large subunit C-terminal domain-containing protein [Tissierellia bacterium]MDD4045735.1 [Fe-Fe] hydrogenase large subunit C-terminal domain-containing protein [Tissierellia bacterium]